MTIATWALVLLALVSSGSLVAALAALAACKRTLRTQEERSHEMSQALDELDEMRDAVIDSRRERASALASLDGMTRQQAALSAVEQQRFATLVRQLSQSEDRLAELRRELAAGQDKTREAVERQLAAIRADNASQLDRMRETVDEKLSRTLNDRLSTSFKQVSDQLDTVSKGLGEIQGVASGVGDLKRVLSNVKTRGILGEVQLGAILREIMAPDQYAENVATVPGSAERVEFAVKLPVEGGEPIWLPIDSKFPGDAYEHLRQAIDEGDAPGAIAARKQLERQIKAEAKDISEKYLSVPATTNFGIMFLPFEGLYAEVVSVPGLVEALQRDYRVNVAGPSTTAAVLNSLQMSYQTFAFQRRADEIQQVLAAVKAEFPKYQAALRRALTQIETAGKTVDGIISTRTNVIERKLRDVVALEDDGRAAELLGIDAGSEGAEAGIRDSGDEDGAELDAE